VVGDGGVVAASDPELFADAVLELLERPGARQRARTQAELFNWQTSGDRMLEIHAGLRRSV
jgi:alpha-1,6-mannosyltransferase